MLFQWQTPKNDLITVGCKHLLAANLKHLKKKRRPQVSNPIFGNKGSVVPTGKEDEQSKIFKTLAEAFSLASLDDVVSAFRQANSDPNKATRVLAMSYNADDPSTSSGLGSKEGLDQSCDADELGRSSDRFGER